MKENLLLQKKLKFCKSELFCELHDEKTLFSIMGKWNSISFLFLPWNYFLQRWAIWQRTQLLILLEHLYIFKHKHKSNIKGAIIELRSSQLFRDRPYKEVLEVKFHACDFTDILSFTGDFEDFGHIFPTCFLRNFSYF